MTAPASASRLPRSEPGEPAQSPYAIRAAPSSASGVATSTTGGGLSRRNSREKAIANSGAVLTSRTEEAIEV